VPARQVWEEVQGFPNTSNVVNERSRRRERGAGKVYSEQFTDLGGSGEVFSFQCSDLGSWREECSKGQWEGGKKRRGKVIKFLEILGDPGEQ
jgi:hypothetical protein